MIDSPQSPDGVWRGPNFPRMGDMLPRGVQLIARQGPTLICGVQTLSGINHRSHANQIISVALCIALGVAWGIVGNRRRGDFVDVTALVAVIGIGAWMQVLSGHGQAFVSGYSAVFVAPFWYRVPVSLLPWFLGVAEVTLVTAFVGTRDISGGIGSGVGAAFFGLAAMFWGRVLRSSQANATLVHELQESRDAEHRNAVVAERARLARELHDVLAHTLSSLSLHLESTRVLAKSRDVDAEVVERIDRALSLARSGLVEARNAVGTLRDDELPGPDRLASLVAEFERTSGIEATYDHTGTPGSLAPDAQIALFRAAQESLTNVAKHSHAGRVAVQLDWGSDEATLRISDDGSGPAGAAPLPGGGNGLRGMRERAELVGGSVTAGPTEKGFAVTVVLPLAGASTEPAK